MSGMQVSDVTSIVKSIWAQVLDMPVDNETDNFFALGGSSMQAVEIITRINETLHTDLSIMDFFEALTIEKLLRLI